MSATEANGASPLDSNGMLSTDFIAQSGLRTRVLAGAPTLLELGILSFGLKLHAREAVFELFEDNGSLFRSHTTEPTVASLVNLVHDKFSKVALVTSLSNSEMAYFDYSNDYSIFLGREHEIDRVFHLDRDQMFDYFNDTLEEGLDEAYLKSVWAAYEPLM